MPRAALETACEREVNRWYDARFPEMRTKLTLFGRRGWPDQVYWIPGGRPLLIEYKKKGEEPRKLQLHIHANLRKAGYDVQTHEDFESAKSAILAAIAAAGKLPRPAEGTARPVD